MVNKHIRNIGILLGLGYLLFIIGNGVLGLTIPDEVFYAQTAKEMIQHHSWMTPYLFDTPQFEKPIFTYWLLRIGFIFFGVSSFGARFFPAVFALIGASAVYFLAVLGFDNPRKAFLTSAVLMSCGLYLGLARTVFTDMIFSVCILLSLASFWWGYVRTQRKGMGIVLFCFFAGLAVLTKGPLGAMIPLLVVIAYLAIKKEGSFLFSRSFLWGIGVFLLIAFPWYMLMYKKYGAVFTHEFFYNDHVRRLIEAEHTDNDRWYFYPFSIFGCIFPWTFYLAAAVVGIFKNIKRITTDFFLFLFCWIAVVLVIFQPAHSKLVSYIFPLFPALSFLVGDFLYEALTSKKEERLFLSAWIATTGLVLLCAIAALVGAVFYSRHLSFFKGPFLALCVLMFILALIMVYFMRRGQRTRSVYVLVSFNILLLFCLSLFRENLEPYLSPKIAVEYLLRNYKVDTTILCSKFFVRGVRYYSDKKVAVLDIPGKQFFSPHPIPFIDSDAKANDFFLTQKVTYCLLKKSALDDIQRLTSLKRTILTKIGNEYIVKVERP